VKEIITAPGIDSHLPVLKWAQRITGGAVLEFGGGMHSTAFLVDLDAFGLRTATIEADEEWRKLLRERWPDHHTFGPKATDLLLSLGWGVTLIDHGEGEWAWIDQRADALMAVRGHTRIALVHDWHIGPGHRDDLVGAWKHHAWFAPDDGTMHTAMCSDSVAVEEAEILGGRVYSGWEDAPSEWPN
jgi:hypothetical protein